MRPSPDPVARASEGFLVFALWLARLAFIIANAMARERRYHTRYRDIDLWRAKARVRELRRHIDRVRRLDRRYLSARTLASNLDSAILRSDRDFGRLGSQALDTVLTVAVPLLRQAVRIAEAGAPTARAGRSARGLTAAAAALLPAGQRERYREEWAHELECLAGSGASRRVQAGHALGLLRGAPVLRAALTAPRPRRRRASP